jgi:2-polyprenyl-3-methyl-5-hydroxy-6-metoxy-1,4-benzoquinol methylase
MLDHGSEFYQQHTLYLERSHNIRLGLPLQDWRYQTAIKRIKSEFSGVGKNLLDIGCGDGGFLEIAKNVGYTVFGIDVDERSI